jgi:hypothetical protein
MKTLDVSIRDKVDAPLRKALEGGDDSAFVTAILLLDLPTQSIALTGPSSANPRDFPSGEAYRAALIRLRREHLRSFVEPVLWRFSQLGLRTLAGGDLTPAVAVIGSPSQVAEAVAFPEVRLASLDTTALTVPCQPG